MAASDLATRLRDALGPEVVRTEPEDLAVYAFDAYSEDRLPTAAIVPRDAREVGIAVRIAREHDEPIVPRGAGTGLCGGAVPSRGGLVVSFARMNRLVELDVRNRRARVQPGLDQPAALDADRAARRVLRARPVEPEDLDDRRQRRDERRRAALPLVRHDDESRARASSTSTRDGDVHRTSLDDPGYDLTGVLVGSEGTLGIVTEVDVRLLKLPEAVRVCVAAFADVETASDAVSAIIGAGIVPTALEIMDALITRAVEAHYHAGYPENAGAVLLVEIAGAHEDVAAGEAAISRDRARSRCAVVARGARRGGARRAVGRAQGRRRRDRAHRAELLHPGRVRAAHAAARGDARDRRDRARARAAGRQRLPRRRRQPAPAADLRPPRAAPSAGRGRRRHGDSAHVHRDGRHDQRRARDRLREERDALARVLDRRSRRDGQGARRVRSGRARSIRTRSFRPARSAARCRARPPPRSRHDREAAARASARRARPRSRSRRAVPARAVAPPDAAGVAAALRDAADAGEAVVVFGGGTLQRAANAPSRYDVALEHAASRRDRGVRSARPHDRRSARASRSTRSNASSRGTGSSCRSTRRSRRARRSAERSPPAGPDRGARRTDVRATC